MTTHLRRALLSDAAAISEIYNESVTASTASWQIEPDTVEARREWLAAHDERYPTVVVEVDGEVVAWGSLSPFRPREAWLPTVENSIYVRADRQRRGLGRMVLTDLIVRARELGYRSIVAGISADQPGSIALHTSEGFVEVGRIVEGGIKFGRRLDCVFLQLML